MEGIVAAGHPVTAEAGAARAARGRQRRRRGDRGDAGVVGRRAAADRAGRRRLHARGRRRGRSRRCWTSSSPRRARRRARAPLLPIEVSFGDAMQIFHVGAASCGVPGTPAGLEEAARRWGTLPLADLAAPAAALARDGVALNAPQAYVFEILEGILLSTPRGRRAVRARRPRAARGRAFRSARAGRHDRAPRRRGRRAVLHGDIAAAVVAWVARARRHADGAPTSPATSRSRASRCGSPTAGATVAHQPAAVGRRDPARARAGAARRAAGGPPPSPADARRRDGGRPGRAHAGVRRRASPSPASSSASWPRSWARRRTSRCSTATAARAR